MQENITEFDMEVRLHLGPTGDRDESSPVCVSPLVCGASSQPPINRSRFSACCVQPEEALSSAVEEFTAQGVNLSNIIKTVEGGNVSAHPAAAAAAALDAAAASGDADAISASAVRLAEAAGSADAGAAFAEATAVLHRAGATAAVARGLAATADAPAALAALLRTLEALLGGASRDLQSDFLGAGGVHALADAQQQHSGDAALAAAALRAAAAVATKNEEGKAALMLTGLGSSSQDALQRHGEEPEVLDAACAVLCALTNPDDDSTPASRWVLGGVCGRLSLRHSALQHCR